MTLSDRDPVDLLRDLRPNTATLDRQWPVTERAELRRRLLVDHEADDPDRPVRFRARPDAARALRRIALPAAVLAVAATVITVLLPSGTPAGPDRAAAAELRRLAVVAGRQGGTVGARQYAYTALIEEQTVDDAGQPPLPGETRVGDVDRRPRMDRWRAPSGVTFVRIGGASCVNRIVYTDADAQGGVYEDLTGAQLAALPTDPSRLAAFFDDHPSGDNRNTRNRFLAAGDLVRSGLASPRLRAAALRVLADSVGLTVRTGRRDERGRAATTVAFAEGTSVETLYFDPATSRVLEQRQSNRSGDSHYSGVFLANRVVDRLPDLPRCPADTADPTRGKGG